VTILTTKTIRRAPIVRVRQPDLTPDEQANVRKAIRFLAIRLGRSELAARLGMTLPAVRASLVRTRPVSPALAIRVARVAEAKVDAVLAGEWPPEGACPHCGRG